MKRKFVIAIIALTMTFNVVACGKNVEKAPDVNFEEQTDKEETDNVTENVGEAETEPEQEPDNISSFSKFVGNYSFMSGAGAWSTDVILYDDGTFEGEYHDSDMGDVGDDYANGTVYFCKFSGKFSPLVQKDEYTFTCSLETIEQEGVPGTEEISEEDGVRYITSDPYGFENASEFEFYLPGKNVGELNNDLTTWLSIRFNQPYPDTLPCKVFSNLAENEGFEENGGYIEDMTAEYPDSLPVDDYMLAGKYHNDNLNVDLNISIYTDYVEGDAECGNISWDIPDDCYVWNDDAVILRASNGYDVHPGFYGEYKIIITDNTDGKIVIHLYDSNGFDCGEYVMTEHFES